MNEKEVTNKKATEGIGRGGFRPGAGRKCLSDKLKRRPITVTLPPDILERLKNHDLPVSRQVEIAVRKYLKVSKWQ